jgi:hypothetical protein
MTISKAEAVHIQASMHPYRPKTGLKISCDSPFKATKRGFSIYGTWGYRCKELIAKSPLTFLPDNPHFHPTTDSVIFSDTGFSLLADSGNWHAAIKSF